MNTRENRAPQLVVIKSSSTFQSNEDVFIFRNSTKLDGEFGLDITGRLLAP
ncbi:MAG: hypothetical protein P8H97_09435 [Pseudomonadales bacterium]|nr:hypothetical protein [Pseudomonadales bacterium]